MRSNGRNLAKPYDPEWTGTELWALVGVEELRVMRTDRSTMKVFGHDGDRSTGIEARELGFTDDLTLNLGFIAKSPDDLAHGGFGDEVISRVSISGKEFRQSRYAPAAVNDDMCDLYVPAGVRDTIVVSVSDSTNRPSEERLDRACAAAKRIVELILPKLDG